jgi:hypothetical protein
MWTDRHWRIMPFIQSVTICPMNPAGPPPERASGNLSHSPESVGRGSRTW